jgi:hypothetical protein
VFPLTDSAKRAAYVLAHGAHRAEAMARADAALARIRIDTRPDSSVGVKADPPAGAIP